MNDIQQIIQIVLAISTFALVLSLWIGGMLLWASKRAAKTGRVRRRLGLEMGQQEGSERVLHLWHDGRQISTTVPKQSVGSMIWRMERRFQQAGFAMSLGQALTMVAGAAALTIAFIFIMTENLVLAIGVAAALVVILNMFVQMRINNRSALFETQLMDALELAARSLRAGHPLMGAFQLLSEEMAPPVSTVFSEICQRHGMGADLEQVLREAGEEASNSDMRLFATSVAIQIRTGGNLADLMERLAEVIRDRMRVQRRTRVLTAQTQMSKRILIGLPIGLFFVMNFVNPDYMRPFFENNAAKLMLGIGVVLLVMGAWIMNRMAIVKY